MEPSERESNAVLLSQRIQPYVESGWRVEHRDDLIGRAVLVREGTQVNHVLHLLLSIVTVGMWLMVWFLLGGLHRQTQRIVVSIDDPPGSHADRRVRATELPADAATVYRAVVDAIPSVAHLVGTRTAELQAILTTRAGGFSWGGERLVVTVAPVSDASSEVRVTTSNGAPVPLLEGRAVTLLLREVGVRLRNPSAPVRGAAPIVRRPVAIAAIVALVVLVGMVALF